MLNVEQFANLAMMSYAISLAKPGMRGQNFSWGAKFPKLATSYMHEQWFMATRNPKILESEKNKKILKFVAEKVAKDFSEITGVP